ncbi:toll/interleukin-1 receptor domain-containing protein [Comamonas aquatica]|uniref:toll/interleukin-1 receptor domain-containing protein n=1 Tax=Comamonas aquatica TaxID=225991 RepID=UPI001EF195AB|nr:toll/interleukin-1 receptor domain-containing protein [Comamonas aquatica]
MFADVCVNNFSGNLLEDVSSYAVDAYKKRNQNIFVNLEEYLLDEGNIFSADKIIEKLFPQIDVDIFLSHSHSDQDEVIKLAVKLEELGLKVFVDSCYWGYVLELQKKIDSKYSRKKKR